MILGNCYGGCAHTCTTDNPPRKYSTLAGLTNSRSVVLDDNLLCNAHDPYAHKENVLVHEFSHLVKLYSPASIKSRVSMVVILLSLSTYFQYCLRLLKNKYLIITSKNTLLFIQMNEY